MGRPRRNLDDLADQIGGLAFEGASDRDIAAIVGIPRTTLERRFGPLLTKRRAERRQAIRRAQNEAAVGDKNPTMLIWLGKQELDQTDKPAPTSTTVNVRYEQRGIDDRPPEPPPGPEGDPGAGGPV